jgi:hypothetical protein
VETRRARISDRLLQVRFIVLSGAVITSVIPVSTSTNQVNLSIMFSYVCNRLRGSHSAARSLLSSASSTRAHDAKAASAPPILRHGAARATSNRVQWDGIVRVKAIPLELNAIDPECARCRSLYSERCACNRWDNNIIGGFRVCLVTDELPCTEARSSFDRTSERFVLDTASRPTTPSASLESSVTPVVVSTTCKTLLRRKERSRRNNARQLALNEPVAEIKAGASVQATQDAVRHVRKAHARILKDLDCTLDGTYWNTHINPRRHRALVQN